MCLISISKCFVFVKSADEKLCFLILESRNFLNLLLLCLKTKKSFLGGFFGANLMIYNYGLLIMCSLFICSMAAQLRAKRLDYKTKAKLILKNTFKLGQIYKQLQTKERIFETNESAINKWTSFKSEHSDIIDQYAVCLNQVIFICFFVNCLFML